MRQPVSSALTIDIDKHWMERHRLLATYIVGLEARSRSVGYDFCHLSLVDCDWPILQTVALAGKI